MLRCVNSAAALYARRDLVEFAPVAAVGPWVPSREEAILADQDRFALLVTAFEFFCVPPELCWGVPLVRALPKLSKGRRP